MDDRGQRSGLGRVVRRDRGAEPGMHKTQGFGFGGPAVTRARGSSRSCCSPASPRPRTFFDGVDTTWDACPVAPRSGAQADADHRELQSQGPGRQRARAAGDAPPARAGCPRIPSWTRSGALLDRIIQACLGLEVDTVVDHAEVVPGERVKLRHTAACGRASRCAGRRCVIPVCTARSTGGRSRCARTSRRSASRPRSCPPSTPLSQPYWLREEHAAGLFAWTIRR